jgi:hypothetical protein
VVRAAIQQLPDAGQIADGRLDWRGDSPVSLAANRFLSFGVDLNHSGELGREAHLQIEFGRRDLRVFAMLGYRAYAYPEYWRVAFNRAELDPWWGAWQPAIIAAVALGMLFWLMLSWTLLATMYFLPVKLVALFQNRDLTLCQSWRMAGAACLPGALFLTVAILCYGSGVVDLIQLGGLAVLHFVVPWVYLVVSPLFLPKRGAFIAPKANPFVPPATPTAEKGDAGQGDVDPGGETGNNRTGND